MKILIYGYGNPGRQDDGLGILFAEELEKWAKSENLNISFDSNYQLNAEDAYAVSRHDTVIFADASSKQEEDYLFRGLKAGDKIAFSTHSMSPESVLSLCGELYNKQPETYLVTIKGCEWEPNAQVTAKAAQNLAKAVEFMKNFLKDKNA
jgi:hydrogenase maturation protease